MPAVAVASLEMHALEYGTNVHQFRCLSAWTKDNLKTYKVEKEKDLLYMAQSC